MTRAQTQTSAARRRLGEFAGQFVADPTQRAKAVRWGAVATAAAVAVYALTGTSPEPRVAVADPVDELPAIDVAPAAPGLGAAESDGGAVVDQAFDRFLERLYDDADSTSAPAAPERPTGDVAEFEEVGAGALEVVANPFAGGDEVEEAELPGLPAVPAVPAPAEVEPEAEPETEPETETEPAPEPTAAEVPAEVEVEPEVEILAGGQVDGGGALRVTVNDSRVIETTRPYHRVAIARDGLAALQPISPTQLLVTAKEPGTTQLVFWDRNDNTQTFLLQSSADVRQVQAKIDALLPGERIEVVDLGGKLGLSGVVSGVDASETATRIAGGYGTVENLLQLAGKQQVSLRIRFAEVSRTAGKQFGLNLGFDAGEDFAIVGSNLGGVSPFGVAGGGISAGLELGIPNPGEAVQLFGLFGEDGDTFGVFLNALRDANLLSVLADPELTVLSGEEGSFLAGGTYPVPVPQEEGIAIDYREFGVRLTYRPIVLGDGRIRMQLLTEVSDLDESIGVATAGVIVPGERVRSTTTTVEMLEGQTLAISGLLRSRTVASKSGVPLLGDIPLVGAAFRNVRYRREETELVVLVTPRLVEALDSMPPRPGEGWRHPNDVELMLFGQLGGVGGVGAPDEADLDGSDDYVHGGPPRLRTSYAFTPGDAAAE